ncbi:MAG: FAD-dependent monooxygenase, partial [Chloroflexi bacterium]|nr:FAD-dependent monooxygenase [Chloroflexota bacterium]
MYDAIIVGARVAGSATAIFLAKAGYRVLLVDKDTFPSFTLSSHFFWAKAHTLFAELGVLSEIESTSAPPLYWHASESEVRTIVAEFPAVDGQRAARCLRRIVLDKILLDAARKYPNIDVREKFTVQELMREDGKVIGIRGHSPKSDSVE